MSVVVWADGMEEGGFGGGVPLPLTDCLCVSASKFGPSVAIMANVLLTIAIRVTSAMNVTTQLPVMRRITTKLSARARQVFSIAEE